MIVGYLDNNKRDISIEEQRNVVGRVTGSKNKKYLCEEKYAEIKSCLARGMSRRDTAKHVNVSIASLYNFLRVHPELKEVVNG